MKLTWIKFGVREEDIDRITGIIKTRRKKRDGLPPRPDTIKQKKKTDLD